MIKEIESVVNSRPLVYVDDDINSNIPLTPGHFLSLNPKTGIRCIEDQKDQDYTPFQSTGDTVYKSWKKGQRLLDQFWALWREEYLTGLRERKQYLIRSNRIKSNSVVQKGDVVLIKDNTPRGCWKIRRIIDYIVSRDGQIRSAEIQLAPGKVLRRPLNLLYQIECPQYADEQLNLKSKTADVPEKSVKNKRKAALEARRKFNKQF